MVSACFSMKSRYRDQILIAEKKVRIYCLGRGYKDSRRLHGYTVRKLTIRSRRLWPHFLRPRAIVSTILRQE